MKFYYFFIIVILNIGCDSSNVSSEVSYTDLNIKKEIKGYSDIIIKKDTILLKTITTNKGYKSIVEWSDSLRDINFLKLLANDLNSKNIIFTINSQNEFEIHTGNNTGNKFNLPIGFLKFKKVNNNFKIDGYSGE